MGIASLVLGLFGIIGCVAPFLVVPFLGFLIFPILSIVFGGNAVWVTSEYVGFGIAGFTLGIIEVIICIGLTISDIHDCL
ncbi:hypothetical protein KJA17_00015 [Patescibacteria group bacterium]|nr:hypothetical protein [Patescibacteria group bacterium]